MLFHSLFFFERRISLARRNEAPQALVDIEAPGAGTAAVTLDRRHQTHVRKTQFGLIALSGDFENDVGAVPLRVVFDEVDLAVDDMPHNVLTGDEFSDLLRAAVKVFVMKPELAAEPVRVAFDLLRPPTANVVDCVKNFFGRLVHCKGGCVVFRLHRLFSFIRYYGARSKKDT